MIVACALTATFFPVRTFSPLNLVLLSLPFVLVASGNTLFGALVSVPARILGQISYGIYLLHGILLYFIFRYVLGFKTAAGFSHVQWDLVICGCVIPLIAICAVTYRLIEAPALGQVATVRALLAKTGVPWFQITIPQTTPAQTVWRRRAANRPAARRGR